ncbi:hypothetical protein GWI33_002349 [Rhynchophorus ferrugineus]|uniref:Uncharacterized protein n=1 Tax=Rhynchophorus ferrugineus TaxID=354439 RepID=A0A834IMI5_RHYFE|nr:hypothetical protein GWI33_002349 [Rhynchophorus ferrugineus]
MKQGSGSSTSTSAHPEARQAARSPVRTHEDDVTVAAAAVVVDVESDARSIFSRGTISPGALSRFKASRRYRAGRPRSGF